MIQSGVDAISTRHRFHTVNQIYQFLLFLADDQQMPYPDISLISDFSFSTIVVKKESSSVILKRADELRSYLARSDRVIFEVSSLREAFLDFNGRCFYVNNFIKRDIQNNLQSYISYCQATNTQPLDVASIKVRTLNQADIVSVMKMIKLLLPGKDILWINHVLPSLPETNNWLPMIRVRKELSMLIRKCALDNGDYYYNPSWLVNEFGVDRAFERPGEDYDHFSKEFKEALALLYSRKFGDFAERHPFTSILN